jgi:nicotinamide riboside transporter PnuC
MPEYEERQAARFGYYTWEEWQQLSHEEKARGIAHMRVEHQIELLGSDAVDDHIEKRRRRATK